MQTLNPTVRLSENRLKTAHAVLLRDANPLIELEKMLRLLIKETGTEGGVIVLCVEDDVPIALCDINEVPELTCENEKRLFNGETLLVDEFHFKPIYLKKDVVGYICLKNQIKSGPTESLLDAYSKLAGKELELANQTAELQYQNEMVSRKQKQLEQAISFKNSILSLTTHDLRNPLGAVSGFMEMLGSEIGEKKPDLNLITDYHKKIKRGLSDISDLVEQLNEIALHELERIELNPIKVDINWIVQEVVDVMQGPAIAKKQKLVYQRYEKPIYVEVDIPKTKRIIFNLIGNAIKYTHQDGNIEVTLFKEKGLVHIAVKDNGIGIAEEKQHAIFEPFHKVSKSGTDGEKATGLGLFVSNYFVRLLKGSISVESQRGVGSTFYVHLPIIQIEF